MAASMSEYLVRQIDAAADVEVLHRTSVDEVHRDDRLEAVTFVDHSGGRGRRESDP